MNLVLKGFSGTLVALEPQETGIASQGWWTTDAHTNNTVHALILNAVIVLSSGYHDIQQTAQLMMCSTLFNVPCKISSLIFLTFRRFSSMQDLFSNQYCDYNLIISVELIELQCVTLLIICSSFLEDSGTFNDCFHHFELADANEFWHFYIEVSISII